MKLVKGKAAIQGSDAWHKLRCEKIGASASPALLAVHPYMTEKDVYEQMMFGKKSYVNKAMTYGTEQEPIARNYYNSTFLTDYEPVVCVNDQFPYMMASLDGWETASNTILEIKCPGDKVFNECLKDKVPLHWKYQIQHQLLVSGAEFAKLFIWKDEEHKQLIIYSRDGKMMGEIQKACEKFYNENLLQFQIPEAKENDYPLDEDEELKSLVDQYINARDLKKEYETLEEVLKEQIVLNCKGNPKRTPNAVIEKFEVKGRIDYELIEELKNLDVEQYRKPPTIRWKISETDVK